jgi:Tfp pilus assembly protein PilV
MKIPSPSFLRGFTLIETMVATFVITMTIIGPLSVALRASAYSKITKDTLTATYLAQEAIELLHHQQDSVYIRCAQETGNGCTLSAGESYSNAAWRIFRDRFNANGGTSCFANENALGCSFDFIDMSTNESVTPTKYRSDLSSCNTLSIEKATNLYVCGGVHGIGAGYTPTRFTRSISITSIPTWGGGTSEQNYNDDLRVTVTVTFRQPNGYKQQVQITDFVHARS